MPLVKSNLGIGLIPEPMAQSGDVYILKTDEEFPKRSIVLAENADKKLKCRRYRDTKNDTEKV